MKILIIVDKTDSAIDRLSKAVQRNLPHQQIIVFPVHPKRSELDTFIELEKLLRWADVIHVAYWKSGKVVREQYPELFKAKPRMLSHHNPYDVLTEENKEYDIITVNNKEMHNKIPYAHLIGNAIDLSFFTFNRNYTEDKTVMMSVARIQGKKGVKEVAQVCKELGYKFLLIGRISKPDYMYEVFQANDGIEFIENATEQQLLDAYYRSAIHVCNSVDNFESGTMPILEAMATGVPVLTRMIGHVPDLYTGGNMVIRMGQPEDIEDLKTQLKELMENRDLRIAIRERAWETAKNRDDRRMALDFQHLYYNLYKPTTPLVSIIIPTKDHPEAFAECLASATLQEFPKFEIVIADSGDVPVREIVEKIKQQTEVPIKYIYFPNKGNYTLAEARNRAVIEADGSIIVLCDDRLRLAKNVVNVFATYARPRTWLWGQKDGTVKAFVENFSCVRREDLIKHGMFNERIQWYGGMTQDIRSRFEASNNFSFVCMPEATAESIQRAQGKGRRREDIIEAKFLNYKLYNK